MEGRTIVRPDELGCARSRSVCPTPSMEGRTIVRPDTHRRRPNPNPQRPSMEGRTIVRPDSCLAFVIRDLGPAFNGGPDDRPAGFARSRRQTGIGGRLQWRAGRSSGRIHADLVLDVEYTYPSMEGRTIVRPDADGERSELLQWFPSMEGRTIVRPDPLLTGTVSQMSIPSMEGRTIVRPDLWLYARALPRIIPSMEGRTIVRPDAYYILQGARYIQPSMEGRTIVRPDLSTDRGVVERHTPSMEGRTIVRPDRSGWTRLAVCPTPFNGGPDDRPAGSDSRFKRFGSGVNLQWRAGRSSGRIGTPHPTLCPT